jgi:hypothetical protein
MQSKKYLDIGHSFDKSDVDEETIRDQSEKNSFRAYPNNQTLNSPSNSTVIINNYRINMPINS